MLFRSGLSQGLHTVIEAAALLKDYPDIVIVFIGEGVKKPALQARASELGLTNVRFLPFQPKSELTWSLGTADVSLISLKKGLGGFIVPSKLYGVLAAGRAYVAAVEKDGEPTVVAEKFGCGVAAEPETPSEIAEKILYL